MKSLAALVLSLLAIGAGSASAEPLENRDSEPVVLTGSEAPRLAGTPLEDVVGFAWFEGWGRQPDGWVHVPIQVDKRTRGADGVLRYAEPSAGAKLDGDDEIALMAYDAGLPAGDRPAPDGVDAGSRTSVTVTDPLEPGQHAYIYLFRSEAGIAPHANADLVDFESPSLITSQYDLRLGGPFSVNRLSIAAAESNDVDILDGDKLSLRQPGCATSERALGVGAGITEIDGPIRTIRSVHGAVGPAVAEREYLFYEGMFETRTTVRGLDGPARVTSALDLSRRALGYTYRNASHPGGVTIDGTGDGPGGEASSWDQFSGRHGSITSVHRVEAPAGAEVATFFEDASDPAESPLLCSGDDRGHGAGPQVTLPAGSGNDSVDLTRLSWVDGAAGAELARLRALQAENPLRVQVGVPEPAILVARVRPSRVALRAGASRTIRVVIRNHGRKRAKAVRLCAAKTPWNRARARCRKAAGVAPGRRVVRKVRIRASHRAGKGAKVLRIALGARKAHAYGARVRVHIKRR